MRSLIQVAKRRLRTERLDARAGQFVCFAAAIVLFLLAVLKLCSLALTEAELVIGLLATIACMLQLIVLGLLFPLSGGTRSRDD